MKIKSIKAITLSMPFSHGGKKVIFHGKEWKSLEFNLVKIETDKGITGWEFSFLDEAFTGCTPGGCGLYRW